MDVFLIHKNTADNIDFELLKQFQNKRISNVDRMKMHCLSYLMTNRILKETYKIKNRDIEFINNKPFLKSKEKFFSISHSGEYIALGFSDFDCGIDIEKMKHRDFILIAKRMNFASRNAYDFYAEWTAYEAGYKLNKEVKSTKQWNIPGYTITAVSINPEEKFRIYIQNEKDFSKSYN